MVRNRDGMSHELRPIFDTLLPSARMLGTADTTVWEWIFLVLEEEEDVNELWWRPGRWIWAGRFELGREVVRGGEAFPARPHTENPNVVGEIFRVEGWNDE